MNLLHVVPRRVSHLLKFSLGVVGLIALTARPSQGQFVQNGTFDLIEPGTFWSAANIDGAGGWRPTDGNPTGHFILNDNGNPATDPTISQTINGLAGSATYQVTGDFRRVYSTGASAGSFGVAIDGNFLFQGENPLLTYAPFSFTFVAPGPSVVLSLAGERLGSDVDYSVDNINIALVRDGAVPEPGTLAFLAGPALLAGYAVRRKGRGKR
jgi:hypothetical protein